MAENEVEDGEEKKSSKKIIIIALAVLLVVGGGVGYYFFMGNSDDVNDVQVEEQETVEEEEEGVNEEIYYDLKKPLIVNFPKGSGASLIQVSISLLVKGEETVETLKKHEPMIRNNLLMEISKKDATDLKTLEGKEALRDGMLKEIGKVMEKMTKKNRIVNLFFTSFVMQ